MADVERIVGVYDADGGLAGEARYVFGKLIGTAHCSLCDITHSPVRRKREWDRFVDELDVPFSLLHRNEQDEIVAAFTATTGLPVVVAMTSSGPEVLASPEELGTLDGSVARFRDLVAGRLLVDRESPADATGLT